MIIRGLIRIKPHFDEGESVQVQGMGYVEWNQAISLPARPALSVFTRIPDNGDGRESSRNM